MYFMCVPPVLTETLVSALRGASTKKPRRVSAILRPRAELTRKARGERTTFWNRSARKQRISVQRSATAQVASIPEQPGCFLGYVRDNQRCLATVIPGNGCHTLDPNGRDDRSLLGQGLSQCIEERCLVQAIRCTTQQHVQPVLFLHDLPSTDRHSIHYPAKHVRDHRDFTTGASRKMQPLRPASLNALKENERASTGAIFGARAAHPITHLVTNERLRTAEEDGEQHFVTIDTRRNRTVLFINHFHDDHILVEMQAPMRRAFRRQHATLGGSVDVKEACMPGMLYALPRFICQGLGPTKDEVGRDLQSSLLLLFCQHA